MYSCNLLLPRGHSSLVLVEMCPLYFEGRPMHLPIFQEKVVHSLSTSINEINQFVLNFHKFKKKILVHQILHFKRDHRDTRLILLPIILARLPNGSCVLNTVSRSCCLLCTGATDHCFISTSVAS